MKNTNKSQKQQKQVEDFISEAVKQGFSPDGATQIALYGIHQQEELPTPSLNGWEEFPNIEDLASSLGSMMNMNYFDLDGNEQEFVELHSETAFDVVYSLPDKRYIVKWADLFR